MKFVFIIDDNDKKTIFNCHDQDLYIMTSLIPIKNKNLELQVS